MASVDKAIIRINGKGGMVPNLTRPSIRFLHPRA